MLVKKKYHLPPYNIPVVSVVTPDTSQIQFKNHWVETTAPTPYLCSRSFIENSLPVDVQHVGSVEHLKSKTIGSRGSRRFRKNILRNELPDWFSADSKTNREPKTGNMRSRFLWFPEFHRKIKIFGITLRKPESGKRKTGNHAPENSIPGSGFWNKESAITKETFGRFSAAQSRVS